MPQVSRRALLAGSSASLLGASFGGCAPQQPISASIGEVAATPNPVPPEAAELLDQQSNSPVPAEPRVVATAASGPVPGERFPVPAAPLSRINPTFLRARVAYASKGKPGTIVIDPGARYLYFIEEGGRAMRGRRRQRRLCLVGHGGRPRQAGMYPHRGASPNAGAAPGRGRDHL